MGAEYGSQSTNVYSLGLAVPRPWGNPALLDLRIHQLFHNYQPWSSYTELLRWVKGRLCSTGAHNADAQLLAHMNAHKHLLVVMQGRHGDARRVSTWLVCEPPPPCVGTMPCTALGPAEAMSLVCLCRDDGRHALGYELGWRRLAAPQRTASRAVTTQLGDTVKSAVKYVFRQDTFDDVRYPTSGWGVRSTTEVAGLGQEAGLLRFVKQHVTGQVSASWATCPPHLPLLARSVCRERAASDSTHPPAPCPVLLTAGSH